MADFGLAEGQGYMLDRNHLSACRLNLQSYLWRDAIGYNVHPLIPLAEDYVVADIACGTGAWLIDVARTSPNATLEGFDNDPTQAPHDKWLPSNVSICDWDIFQKPPEGTLAKYDFIHVRLLVMVIEGDPELVLSNISKMLKPGGYLQWDELDCVNMRVKKVDKGLQADALDQLREMSYANGRYNWTLQLPQFMSNQGFHDIRMEHYDDRPDLVRAFNEQHLLTMEEFAHRLIKIGQKEAASKFFRLISEGYQESVTGAALCIPRIVCVGQKKC
jgi:SAM-dependent methyltransferase